MPWRHINMTEWSCLDTQFFVFSDVMFKDNLGRSGILSLIFMTAIIAYRICGRVKEGWRMNRGWRNCVEPCDEPYQSSWLPLRSSANQSRLILQAFFFSETNGRTAFIRQCNWFQSTNSTSPPARLCPSTDPPSVLLLIQLRRSFLSGPHDAIWAV